MTEATTPAPAGEPASRSSIPPRRLLDLAIAYERGDWTTATRLARWPVAEATSARLHRHAVEEAVATTKLGLAR